MTLVDFLSNKEKLKVDIVFLEKPGEKFEKEILGLVQNAKNNCPFLIVNYFSAPPFKYRVPSPLVTVDNIPFRGENISLRGYGQDGVDLVTELSILKN